MHGADLSLSSVDTVSTVNPVSTSESAVPACFIGNARIKGLYKHGLFAFKTKSISVFPILFYFTLAMRASASGQNVVEELAIGVPYCLYLLNRI